MRALDDLDSVCRYIVIKRACHELGRGDYRLLEYKSNTLREQVVNIEGFGDIRHLQEWAEEALSVVKELQEVIIVSCLAKLIEASNYEEPTSRP